MKIRKKKKKKYTLHFWSIYAQILDMKHEKHCTGCSSLQPLQPIIFYRIKIILQIAQPISIGTQEKKKNTKYMLIYTTFAPSHGSLNSLRHSSSSLGLPQILNAWNPKLSYIIPLNWLLVYIFTKKSTKLQIQYSHTTSLKKIY